jgi:hypothetical protein
MGILIDFMSGRTPVRSSNLRSVGYNPFSGTLTIEFHNGRTYAYADVPHAVYEGLMDAESHGRFFAIYIRNGYPFRRIQ